MIQKKRILRFIPMIIMMIVIFVFSAMPGDESGNTSGSILAVIVQIIEKITGSTITEDTMNIMHLILRKCAHFTEYMMLGITTVIALYDRNKKLVRNLLIPLVIAISYAVTDEIHQYFVPDRACAVFDIFIDSCGTFTGIMLSQLFIKIRENKNKSNT